MAAWADYEGATHEQSGASPSEIAGTAHKKQKTQNLRCIQGESERDLRESKQNFNRIPLQELKNKKN